jgi:hypothetical protein
MEFYVPLILPEIALLSRSNEARNSNNRGKSSTRITPEEVEMLLLLSGINLVLIRPEISEIQLQEAEKLIKRLVPLALKIRPGLRATRNLHQLIHIIDDIRAHGPIYSHWCMCGERCGKCIKNGNTNKKTLEITAINARLKASTAGLIQSVLSRYTEHPEDQEAVLKLASFQSGFLKNDQARGSSASELYAEMQADAAQVEAGVYRTLNGRLLGPLKVTPAPLSYLEPNLRPIVLQTLMNSEQNDGNVTYTFHERGAEVPQGEDLDNTYFIQRMVKKHARLDTHYKGFNTWNLKADPTTANVESFRDRMAIYQPSRNVLYCTYDSPSLILLDNILTVKAATNGGQSREFVLLLGRRSIAYRGETEHVYSDQSVSIDQSLSQLRVNHPLM